MARPSKRRVPGSGSSGGGRTTPKGGAGRASKRDDDVDGGGSGRYTAPVPSYKKSSPMWVPILMFALWGLGFLVIIGNYLAGDSASNWYLLIGLGLILGGILTATQYR